MDVADATINIDMTTGVVREAVRRGRGGRGGCQQLGVRPRRGRHVFRPRQVSGGPRRSGVGVLMYVHTMYIHIITDQELYTP